MPRFPVGYVSFHDDPALNFQMNRWMTWIGERAADDLHRVATRIATYDDWKLEMLALPMRRFSPERRSMWPTTCAPPSSSCPLAIPRKALRTTGSSLIDGHYD